MKEDLARSAIAPINMPPASAASQSAHKKHGSSVGGGGAQGSSGAGAGGGMLCVRVNTCAWCTCLRVSVQVRVRFSTLCTIFKDIDIIT